MLLLELLHFGPRMVTGFTHYDEEGYPIENDDWDDEGEVENEDYEDDELDSEPGWEE